MASSDEDDNDEYFVPLVDQRVFGAGLKRKRVAFVPAAVDEQSATAKLTRTSNPGDRYLSVVLKHNTEPNRDDKNSDATATGIGRHQSAAVCAICGQHMSELNNIGEHERSIAHQVCLEHSHPPSHLDRSRIGLKYLQDYGWDIDGRQGLGARQEGIRIPIKAKQKIDTTGLGSALGEEEEEGSVKQRRRVKSENVQVIKVNAKEVRKIEEEKSRRAKKLHQSLYGQDLSQYLGSEG